MKIATWNVNSLKVRLPHVLAWLATTPVDVLCLQETKLTDDKFPVEALREAGYNAVWAGQKTYNGVAILTRAPLSATDVVVNNPLFTDAQLRLLTATVSGTRIVCAYFPNGQSLDSEKFIYKMAWIEALTAWLATEIAAHPELALLGDYNIAPEEIDVHDPALWSTTVLFSPRERAAFKALAALGLTDAFRLFDQPDKSFSWWDYRMLGFRRNHGLRIDHILMTKALAARCTECVIDRLPRKAEQPSDHTPVLATLSD